MTSSFVLISLFALVAPLIVWPIELFLPYPYIIEELAKALLIFFSWNSPHRIRQALIIGILFALTESVLYLFNIFQSGQISMFWLRLLYTIPLHSLTCLLIVFPALKDRRLIVIGFILASISHYFYNHYLLTGLHLLQ